MKKLSYLLSCMALAVSVAFVGCKEPEPAPIVVPPEGGEPLEIPQVVEPGAGKVTLVVHVPDGTCNGIVAVGQNGTEELTWDPSGTDFTPVADTEDWYQVTLTFAADMLVKVIAKTQTGEVSWNTQWGMNTVDEETGAPLETNVLIVSGEGCVIDNSENGGEVKLTTFVENTVTYFDVKAWKSAPCVERNEAGTATFKVTVPATTPATAFVSIAGNWGVDGDPEYWEPGAVLMTREADGTYSLTKEVPAAFQYKYIVSADGTTWDWAYECSKQFDMPVSLQANDVVEAWKEEPWNVAPVPAGNGTFKVTITAGYVEGNDIIFTGNFAEKAWGESDRVMTKNGDVWEWTGDYPENFQCKVIMVDAAGTQTWANGDNQKFDGENYNFSFEFPAAAAE